MAYLGNAPTSVPLSSADILDGSINLADLSATGTKDSTTFLRGDNSFAAVSSDYVLLATTNVTSSTASVSFDGYYSSTYKNYKIIISNFSPVSTTTWKFRFRKSNADVTATQYMGHSVRGYWREAASSGVDSVGQVWSGTNDFGWIIPNNISGSNSQSAHSEITIFDPLNTTYKKRIYHNSIVYTDEGYANVYNSIHFLDDNTNAAHSGITFYANSGNIVNGNFKLYGIK
jgi:hypothetical protein